MEGIRFTLLQKVLEKSLSESTKTITLEKLKGCYPELALTEDGVKAMEIVRSQITEIWQEKSLAEFNAVFKERDVENSLNELDRLIEEAKRRQKRNNIEERFYPDELTPREIVSTSLLSSQQRCIDELEKTLAEIQNDNSNLCKELGSHVTDTDNVCEEIYASLEKLDKMVEIGNESLINSDVLEKLITETSSH